MLFFWSSDYSRRACAFHPGSNKSDFVSVEYACGWVGMEAEMERQTCSCVFWGAVSVCGPQMDLDCRLWDGPACSQMRFLCVGLPSPTAEKPFDLFLKGMFSVQKWSFINWIWGMISITIIFFFFCNRRYCNILAVLFKTFTWSWKTWKYFRIISGHRLPEFQNFTLQVLKK